MTTRRAGKFDDPLDVLVLFNRIIASRCFYTRILACYYPVYVPFFWSLHEFDQAIG